MSKQVTIAFRPAEHVKFAVVDDELIVRYNTGKAGYSSDEFTGAESVAQKVDTKPGAPTSTTGGVPQGASELGQLIGGDWSGKVDAAGNLLKKDGSVMTQPEPTDPLPADFGAGTIDDQVRVLLDWQAAHSWYGNQFIIDGNPLGQPGREPSVRFTTKDGKLRVEPNTVNPLVIPTVTIPAQAMGESIDIELTWPASGQLRYMTSGLSPQATVRFHLTIPDYPHDPANLGQIRVAEKPGSAVVPHYVTVTGDSGVHYDNTADGDTQPNVNFTIGGNGDVNFKAGERIHIAIGNGQNNTTQGSDILLDLFGPRP